MITAEQVTGACIPVATDIEGLLIVESAIDYIAENTTLKVDKSDLSALPSGAKAFIIKYADIMSKTGIASESLGGMSQSFRSDSNEILLFDLLNSLLGGYAKSQLHVIQAESRWKHGR